jgi:ATP-binding cassette subfamily B protein
LQPFEEQEFTKKLNLNLWAKILKTVKKHNKTMLAVIALNIAIAFCDTLFPLINSFAIKEYVQNKDLPISFILLYIVLFLVQSLLIYLFVCNAGKIEVGIVHDIREQGFKKLQELSFSYYDKTPVGWIVSRMTTDVQRIGDVIAWAILDIFWSAAIIIFCIINMFILNRRIALYSLVVFPVLLVVSFFFQLKILKGYRETRKINSKITGVINESINGVKTTKTLVRESRNFDEFEVLTNSMKAASLKVMMYSAVYLPLVTVISSVGLAIVIDVGGTEFLNGVIDITTLYVFINYIMQIFEPVKSLARIFSDMQSAQASAERTFSLLEEEPMIKDTKGSIEKFGGSFNPKYENHYKLKGNIVFKNVSFYYNKNEKVLNNFNLKVDSGSKIALVGETGSGKSTIVNLICRFYEPVSGEIYIDGQDYRDYSQSFLHSNLGYVLQGTHLFSGSIKENIRFGKLDATDKEIIKAAKLVNAHGFIMGFENGYDTEVGEGGSRLSSGQRQLISFARAIISDPSIFILDEATSAVDTETEQKIQRAIEAALKGRTSFIIAHRLSTIRFCDKILVIKNGMIKESGSHNQLLKQKGYYYNLYTNQFIEEEGQRVLSQV